MRIYVDVKPGNCNHCIYRVNVSRYLDMDDYCSLNMKCISKINMDIDSDCRQSPSFWRRLSIFSLTCPFQMV